MGSLNKFKALLGIFIPFFAFFLMSQNTGALSLTPKDVVFNYNTTANGAFDWSGYKTIPGQGQPVGSESYITPVKSLRYMQFSYQPISIDGNHAALHFEANVVYIKNSLQATMIWQYLSSQQITSCFSNSTYLNIENQALSFAQTSWDNGYRNTLTIYGDVTLSGLPSGSTSQSIYCNFGNSSTPYFTSDLPSATSIYLEQNPTSIVFSNNLNDALLAQQIAQYEVQIQLQNQMNDKLDDLSSQSQQNTQDIIDAQDQNTQAIIRSNQKCHQSVNKLNLPDGTFVSNGITWTRSNGSLHGVGTLTDYTFSSSISGIGTILNLPSGTYTFSFKDPLGSPLRVEFNTRDNDNVRRILVVPAGTTSITGTFSNGLKILNISFSGGTIGDDYDILIENIQVQSGSSATAYEPYGQEICKNINEDYYDEQRQADQNISNQTSSSVQGAENQQTTNLIGILSNFLTQLQSFSATDCNLSLPFPSFIGGTQVVNICQGKDVLGNFITVIGTLAMVGFYIPLAVVLLKMIYNEIRSFTNG